MQLLFHDVAKSVGLSILVALLTFQAQGERHSLGFVENEDDRVSSQYLCNAAGKQRGCAGVLLLHAND